MRIFQPSHARLDDDIPPEMSHYLCFDQRENAGEVAVLLRQRDFTVSLLPASAQSGWRLVVRHLLADWRGRRTAAPDYFEAIARHFDGDYEGWEIGPMDRGSWYRSDLITT